MSQHENKVIARRWIEATFGRGDIAVMEELMPLEMLQQGALREQITAYRQGFPDIAVTIDEQLSEGDRVMTMFTVHGTNSGDLLGIAPTNREIEYTMIELDTVEGGQITKTWIDFHPVRVLQQLGLIVGKE